MRPYVSAAILSSLITTGILNGCTKKCGCEADPSRTVSNINATYNYPVYLHLFDTPELYFIICNEDALPEELRSEARNAGVAGINVVVGGKIHNGCNLQTDSFIPNGITLTEISKQTNR
jgi:hypothetical protein